MVQNAKSGGSRQGSPKLNERCEPTFKPVALPALAAAVCLTPRPEPRKRAHEDLPPVLREDTTD